MAKLPLIEIYIKINFTKEKIGRYTSVLKHKNKIEIFKNTYMIDETANRILIRAIIESIDRLKLPSNIVLNTNTSWGFKAILNKDGSIKTGEINSKHNEDLKIQVRDLIIKNGHKLNSVINKDTNNIINNIFPSGEKRITDRQNKYLRRLMKYSNQRIREKDIKKCQKLKEEIEKIGVDNLTLQSAREYIALFIEFEKLYIKEYQEGIKTIDYSSKIINLNDYINK